MTIDRKQETSVSRRSILTATSAILAGTALAELDSERRAHPVLPGPAGNPQVADGLSASINAVVQRSLSACDWSREPQAGMSRRASSITSFGMPLPAAYFKNSRYASSGSRGCAKMTLSP